MQRVMRSFEAKQDSSTISRPMHRFVGIFGLVLQGILGILIHPAYAYFTTIVFLPLYGLKFNFWRMGIKDILRYTVLAAAYGCVIFALTHWQHHPKLGEILGDKYNSYEVSIGELYRDSACTENWLLFLIWVGWIPNFINFLVMISSGSGSSKVKN